MHTNPYKKNAYFVPLPARSSIYAWLITHLQVSNIER